jgi:hypothetical protein
MTTKKHQQLIMIYIVITQSKCPLDAYVNEAGYYGN